MVYDACWRLLRSPLISGLDSASFPAAVAYFGRLSIHGARARECDFVRTAQALPHRSF
jgi:hypothetical protein